MDRVALGTILLAMACRSSESSPESTRAPEDVEARANEIKGRLAAECEAGDASACHRLGASAPGGSPDGAPGGSRSTLEIDTWPAGATGLFLGTTPAETAADCGSTGGTSVMFRADQTPVARPDEIDDGGMIACVDRRKIDPLHRGGPLDEFFLLTTELAFVSFCLYESELRACEINLDVTDNSQHFALELRRKIEKQYGPMELSEADFNCRIESDRDVAFRGTWSWETTTLDDSGRPFPVGTLLLNYGCTPVVERPEIFLVLRDTMGMLRATGHLRGGRLVR